MPVFPLLHWEEFPNVAGVKSTPETGSFTTNLEEKGGGGGGQGGSLLQHSTNPVHVEEKMERHLVNVQKWKSRHRLFPFPLKT